MSLINILTRTGKRRSYYMTLKQSIEAQTYKNIRHIKSNDNPDCTFLTDSPDVFHIFPKKDAGKCFYNLYLNYLGQQVQEGWVIILDDDSKLIDNTFLEKLAVLCDNAEPTDILIYRAKIWDSGVIPRPENMKKKILEYGDVDMACFCIHSTTLHQYSFEAQTSGDYWFLNSIRNDNKCTFKFVKLPIGISANYDGEHNGQ